MDAQWAYLNSLSCEARKQSLIIAHTCLPPSYRPAAPRMESVAGARGKIRWMEAGGMTRRGLDSNSATFSAEQQHWLLSGAAASCASVTLSGVGWFIWSCKIGTGAADRAVGGFMVTQSKCVWVRLQTRLESSLQSGYNMFLDEAALKRNSVEMQVWLWGATHSNWGMCVACWSSPRLPQPRKVFCERLTQRRLVFPAQQCDVIGSNSST